MNIAPSGSQARLARRFLLQILSASLALCFAAPAAHAAKNWFYLAEQNSSNGMSGFALDLESSVSGDTCTLSSLNLALGVGGGTARRYLTASPAWQYGREYHVRAVIGPKDASLYLDGALIKSSQGSFVPDQSGLTAGSIPNSLNDPAQYQIEPETLTISSPGAKPVRLAWPPRTRSQIALSLLSQQDDRVLPGWRAGASVTVDAAFKILPKPDWQQFAPLIDRYGQCVYADWPGKITNDSQIEKALAKEDRQFAEWGASKGYDPYGGYLKAGWKSRATGFYRVEKHKGFWWLITPLGNPCFYTGLDTAPNTAGDFTPVVHREKLFAWLPPKTGPYAGVWGGMWGVPGSTDFVAFSGATSIRIHGANWKNWEIARAKQRLRAWGFSGVGKWGFLDDTPVIRVLYRTAVPNLVNHPDIFDPNVQAEFKANLRSQMAPEITDPYVVGWSVGNEFPEDFTPDEISAILGKDATVPSKRALVDYALKTIYGGDIGKMAAAWQVVASTPDDLYKAAPKPSAADIETLRRYYASSYFAWVYKTVKSIDPNHLYFGYWIVPKDWWVNESDWFTIAPYCDVIGYDHYTEAFTYPGFTRLLRQTDKPILCGEFSFPQDYSGKRGFGRYFTSVNTDAQAGDHYIRWVKDAAGNPYCVGGCWFEYRDESLTGWGPAGGSNAVYGEDYAFGLINVTGRPKWDLVTRIRKANLAAARWRLADTRKNSAAARK